MGLVRGILDIIETGELFEKKENMGHFLGKKIKNGVFF